MRSSRAAGGVLWRAGPDGPEVAVVHRPRYDDWSLPKGHLEPREHATVAAVREIAEETGFTATLGRHLGRTTYPVRSRVKHVEFWAAHAAAGGFAPNDETDELRWLAPSAARAQLSYDTDSVVLAEFERVPAASTTTILVRHARAEPGADDARRELTAHGRAQAQALVPVLLAFGASTAHAAPLPRCVRTAQPLADALGVDVETDPVLGEAVYACDPAAGVRRWEEIRGRPGVPVVFSQDGVIPDVVGRWATAGGVLVPDTRTSTAQAWVVSTVRGEVRGLDRLEVPEG